ncbi:EG45-like domain containing protein [Populus alba x Populus x berolinensis]|nr:EG45-like domain containing protein [Populus alba x Populus x berolinensis]
MATATRVLFFMGLVVSLVSVASAISGTATYYNVYVRPTNAGVPQPCKGGSVTVKIVDRCPSPGCQATIDLSQEAFSQIADLNAGKINIDYTQ